MPTPEARDGVAASPPGSDLEAFFADTERNAYNLAFRITGDSESAELATATAYRSLTPPYVEAALLESVRRAATQARLSGPTAARPPAELAAAVRDAFGSLDQVQRSALELAHGGGLSVAEIAGVLGKEPSLVRSALRSALLQLGALARESEARR